MGLKLGFLHVFTVMAAVNIIFVQEGRAGLFGLPFNLSDLSNQSGPPGPLPPRPSLDNLPLPPREERSDDPQEDEEPQDRIYIGSTVSCNYTSQGGTSCSGCRQVLACYANDVGRLRSCRGLARYCNGGRCSIYPGSQCSG